MVCDTFLFLVYWIYFHFSVSFVQWKRNNDVEKYLSPCFKNISCGPTIISMINGWTENWNKFPGTGRRTQDTAETVNAKSAKYFQQEPGSPTIHQSYQQCFLLSQNCSCHVHDLVAHFNIYRSINYTRPPCPLEGNDLYFMKDCLWVQNYRIQWLIKLYLLTLDPPNWPGKKLTRGNLPQSTGRSKNPRAHNFLRQLGPDSGVRCRLLLRLIGSE